MAVTVKRASASDVRDDQHRLEDSIDGQGCEGLFNSCSHLCFALSLPFGDCKSFPDSFKTTRVGFDPIFYFYFLVMTWFSCRLVACDFLVLNLTGGGAMVVQVDRRCVGDLWPFGC